MGDDLGVGIGTKEDAFGLQLGPQLAEVLDDAVLHHDDTAVAVGMRVGVTLAGPAVRGPTGVTDADLPGEGRLSQAQGEVAQLADVAPDGDVPVLDHGNAGRIIAAIFEPTQAVHDDLRGVSRPNVTDDSTHGSP